MLHYSRYGKIFRALEKFKSGAAFLGRGHWTFLLVPSALGCQPNKHLSPPDLSGGGQEEALQKVLLPCLLNRGVLGSLDLSSDHQICSIE